MYSPLKNYSICIPKVHMNISENTIRNWLNKNDIFTILQYKEVPWKHSSHFKRILMYIDWNKHHSEYTNYLERLEHSQAIYLVDYPNIYHIYKYRPTYVQDGINANTNLSHQVSKDQCKHSGVNQKSSSRGASITVGNVDNFA